MRREAPSAPSERDGEQKKKHIEIIVIGILIGLIFLSMFGYFLWFSVKGKESVIDRPENNRFETAETNVIRGDIMTSDGVVIAYTEAGESISSDKRVYPYGLLFTPITGYMTSGRTGLEASENRTLMTSDLDLDRLKNEVLNIRSKGGTVVTTINSDLQYFCYNLLSGYSGSITVMNPKTGAVLAMVSNPTFDANTVLENWAWLTSDENLSGQLLNRSTQGLYAPGSTFKLITALEYMRENPDTYMNFHYNCTGSTIVDGTEISCDSHYAHGEVDLKHAIAKSCNCAFVEIGKTLDKKKYRELCQSLGFGNHIFDDLASGISTVDIPADISDTEFSMTVFGQGKTMETPLQNLMITSMIADGGKMMKPYIVEETLKSDGEVRSKNKPASIGSFLTESEAEYLRDSMVAVVNEGTTPEAKSDYVQTAGKSGSAQVQAGLENMHAWFTGFAPADDPEISVTIMLENAGHGSMTAAPLFKAIVDHWFAP